MPSLFSTLARTARAAHAHFFGQTDVTLKTPGTSDATVTCILGNPRTETRREDNKTVRVTIRDCRFLTVTTVRHDALIVVDGFTWTIDEVVDRQASHLAVTLRRVTAYQVNRTQYRGA